MLLQAWLLQPFSLDQLRLTACRGLLIRKSNINLRWTDMRFAPVTGCFVAHSPLVPRFRAEQWSGYLRGNPKEIIMKHAQNILAKAALIAVVGIGLSACAAEDPGYQSAGYYPYPDDYYYDNPDYGGFFFNRPDQGFEHDHHEVDHDGHGDMHGAPGGGHEEGGHEEGGHEGGGHEGGGHGGGGGHR
jgi:hypothetical protein